MIFTIFCFCFYFLAYHYKHSACVWSHNRLLIGSSVILKASFSKKKIKSITLNGFKSSLHRTRRTISSNHKPAKEITPCKLDHKNPTKLHRIDLTLSFNKVFFYGVSQPKKKKKNYACLLAVYSIPIPRVYRALANAHRLITHCENRKYIYRAIGIFMHVIFLF